MTEAEIKTKGDVIKGILKAVRDTIKEMPNGCPQGLLYAQLNAFGLSLSQFNEIVNAYENTGLVEVKGNLLFWKHPNL